MYQMSMLKIDPLFVFCDPTAVAIFTISMPATVRCELRKSPDAVDKKKTRSEK